MARIHTAWSPAIPVKLVRQYDQDPESWYLWMGLDNSLPPRLMGFLRVSPEEVVERILGLDRLKEHL